MNVWLILFIIIWIILCVYNILSFFVWRKHRVSIRPVYVSENEDNVIAEIKTVDEYKPLINNSRKLLCIGDLIRLRKNNIIPLYVKYTEKISYLKNIFKEDYVVLCQVYKGNINYGTGFIVIKKFEDYYVREICTESKRFICIYSPNHSLKTIRKSRVVGKIINYNEYKFN